MLDGVIFRLHTGCEGNMLPKELGDDSAMQRTYQRWLVRGVLEAVWADIVQQCDELGKVNWQWQAADAAMGKAFGGRNGRPEPHGSRQGRRETQHPAGGRRRPIERRGGAGQRPRRQAAGRDPGRHLGAVHAREVPVDAALAVQADLQGFEHLVPGAIASPLAGPFVDRLPGAVALRQVAPGRTGAQEPEYGVEHFS